MKKINLIGKEYRDFQEVRKWELLYEDIFLVIVEIEDSRKLLGIYTNDLRVKWELGGDSYSAIVNVWIKNGYVYTRTWGGLALKLDYKTGRILEQTFTK